MWRLTVPLIIPTHCSTTYNTEGILNALYVPPGILLYNTSCQIFIVSLKFYCQVYCAGLAWSVKHAFWIFCILNELELHVVEFNLYSCLYKRALLAFHLSDKHLWLAVNHETVSWLFWFISSKLEKPEMWKKYLILPRAQAFSCTTEMSEEPLIWNLVHTQ